MRQAFCKIISHRKKLNYEIFPQIVSYLLAINPSISSINAQIQGLLIESSNLGSRQRMIAAAQGFAPGTTMGAVPSTPRRSERPWEAAEQVIGAFVGEKSYPISSEFWQKLLEIPVTRQWPQHRVAQACQIFGMQFQRIDFCVWIVDGFFFLQCRCVRSRILSNLCKLW